MTLSTHWSVSGSRVWNGWDKNQRFQVWGHGEYGGSKSPSGLGLDRAIAVASAEMQVL